MEPLPPPAPPAPPAPPSAPAPPAPPAPLVLLRDFIADVDASPLAPWSGAAPWALTARSEAIVRALLGTLDLSGYHVSADVAVHATASVEPGGILKGPLVIGPGCFVAAGAYLRGGNWIAERCSLGPGVELKSSFVFAGTRLAHFNFVGDSILGADVNLEAGSIVCNYRNERADKEVRVRVGSGLHATGCQKFGALVGDHARVGANAVLAPGALLLPGAVVQRGALRDDEVPAP
jgi:bifunctional N-acetylglucosamine-1-phosphate-uridyltransferase/glucosamine-1-phosphate-acetyltransferase GlmU-like protein